MFQRKLHNCLNTMAINESEKKKLPTRFLGKIIPFHIIHNERLDAILCDKCCLGFVYISKTEVDDFFRLMRWDSIIQSKTSFVRDLASPEANATGIP